MTEILTDEIKRRLAKLDALEEGGVDRWDGYDSALSELRKTQKKRDYVDGFINSLVGILDEERAIKRNVTNSWYVYSGRCNLAIDYVIESVAKFNDFEE